MKKFLMIMALGTVGLCPTLYSIIPTSQEAIVQLEDGQDGAFESEDDTEEGCECCCHDEDSDTVCEDFDCGCNCHDDEDDE